MILQNGIEEVERMLKALISALENKHLNACPGPLDPFYFNYVHNQRH